MPIKVLNVITCGLKPEGISIAWLTYCEEMRRQKLDLEVQMDFVYINGLSDFSIEQKYNALGLKTFHLPHRSKKTFQYFCRLIKLLREGKYDIIHANGSSSILIIEMLAGLLANTPVRLAHSRNTQSGHNVIHYLLQPLFLQLCNARFACGKEAGEWLFPKMNFSIISNGKNFSKFYFSEEKRKEMRLTNKLNGKYVIGHVGTFNRAKNHKFLIEVFSEVQKILPNSILYLMGDGALKKEIRMMVRRKGLADFVVFAGVVDNIPDRLQAMDLMVFPSLHEGLPNVVLEWQATGLPCLISDVITKDCAPTPLVSFYSLRNSPKEWADQIKKIQSMHSNRTQNAQDAITVLQRMGFDIKECTHFLIHKYEEILDSME